MPGQFFDSILPVWKYITPENQKRKKMRINQIIGIALLVLGVILLIIGFQSSQAVDDQIMETFTGRFTESTMFLLIAGGVSMVVGLGLLVLKK